MSSNAIVGAFSWNALATVVKALLQFAQFIVIARFLGLSELGFVAFVSLFVSFAQTLFESGFSNALIYFKQLNRTERRQFYTLSLMIGAVLAGLLPAISASLSAFFNIPLFADYVWWISIILFVRIAAAQPLALLQRDLQFKHLSLIEVSAQLLSFLVLCLLLSLGFGVYAVVVSFCVLAFGLLLGGVKASPDRLGLHFTGILKLIGPLKYGLYQSLEASVNFITRQFDQVIVLKVLGPESLGVYSYVRDLIFKLSQQLINPILNRVLFPLLVGKPVSELKRNYVNVLFIIATVSTPLFVGLYWFAKPILELTLGKSWGQYELLASYFALTVLFASVVNPVGALLQGTGQVKRSLIWNIVLSFFRVLIIVFAVQQGMETLAFSLLLFQIGSFLLHWFALVTPVIQLGISVLFRCMLLPILLTYLSIVIVSLSSSYFELSVAAQIMLFAVSAGSFATLLLLMWFKKIKYLIQVLDPVQRS